MPVKKKPDETDEEYKARCRKYGKDYYWRHREEKLWKNKKWLEDNRDHRLKYARQYQRTHREQQAENQRRWRANNKERNKANLARYAKENKAAIKVHRVLGISIREARRQLGMDT